MAPAIRKLCSLTGERGVAKPNPIQCQQELSTLCSSYPTVLVIDGLDECDGWGQLLKILKDIVGSKKTIKLLLSSNETVYGQMRTRTFPSCREATVDEKRNLQAIKYHCYSQVASYSAALNNGESKLLEMNLVELLVEKSHGM